MRDNHRSPAEGNQVVDLSGCRWASVPGITGLQVLVPAAPMLEKLKPGEEGFSQSNFAVGGSCYLSISMLISSDGRWRGGWLLFHCPVGQEELFQNCLKAARTDLIVGLRAERANGGSFS